MVRPPYVYRWTVLIGTVSSVVALSTTALSAQVLGQAPDLQGDAAPAGLPVVGAPPQLPRVVSSLLLTQTARPGPSVALTFDDGPHAEYTPRILALLAEYDARATFCVLGERAQQHPDLIDAIVKAGHSLCDHTVAHDTRLGERDPEELDQSLDDSARLLRAVAGEDTTVRFFRAPEGRWTAPLQRAAAERGLWSLGWSVDSLDWTRPGVDRIVADVQRETRPGAVILFHDGGGPREQTVDALTRLLPWLREQGYVFDVPA